MTLSELLTSTDTNNPQAVKALQTQLRALGYYKGEIDGKWGGRTTDAAETAQREIRAKEERDADLARTSAATEKAKAEAAAALANAKASENTAGSQLARAGTQIVPLIAGGTAGYLGGMNRTPGQIAKIARQVESGTRNAGVAEKIVADALAKKAGLRANAIPLGAGLGGVLAGAYTRERLAPMVPESARPFVLGAGFAETGGGIGYLLSTLKGMNPKVNLDDINTIQSAAADARAKGLIPPEPEVPQEPAKKIANSLRLTNAAREAGAAGKLTKAGAAEFLTSFDLEAATPAQRVAIAKALGVNSGNNFIPRIRDKITTLASKPGASAIIGALIGGGLAADASRSRAEAATGEEAGGGGGVAEMATGAALGGAAGYGVNKIAPMLNEALPIANVAATPFALSDIYGYDTDPNLLASARHEVAASLPPWARVGALETAYQMAQPPAANPLRKENPELWARRGNVGQREMTEQALSPERQAMRANAQFTPDTEAQLQGLLDSGADQGQIAMFLRNLLAPQQAAQLR